MSECPRCAELERALSETQSALETERMRLAACSTAALGYFDGCHEDYKSSALGDVLALVERERKSRDYAEECLAALREAKWHLLGKPMCNLESLLEAIEAVLNRENEIVHPHPLYVGDELDAMAEAIDEPERSHAVGTVSIPIDLLQRARSYVEYFDPETETEDQTGAALLEKMEMLASIDAALSGCPSQVSKQEPTT